MRGRGADAGASGKQKRTMHRGGRKEPQLHRTTLGEMCAHVFKSTKYRCHRIESTERCVVLVVQSEMFQMIRSQIRL